MDTIRRYFGGVKRTFYVYSREEADAKGIKYVPWREARTGDWALSEDGYVGECLKATKYKGVYQFTFSFARIWGDAYAKLNYLERKAARAYSRMSTKHWAESEVKSPRAKRFILAYVMMFMAGEEIDWEKLGLILRPNKKGKNPARDVKFLFKQEIFKKMIQQKMIEVFKDHNKTEKDILAMLDKSFEMAEKNKDPKEMRLATEDYIKMFDMEPEKSLKGILPYGEEVVWEEADDDLEEAKELTGAQKTLQK